jgi:hypothetical protein
MSDNTPNPSPPAGANAGPTKPAADQRRIVTDRLPVPPRRTRTSPTPTSPSASRRVRWIVGGIIALVVIGGGVLLFMQDAAARREAYSAQLRAEREQIDRLDQLDLFIRRAENVIKDSEERLARLRTVSSAGEMRFMFLRRFGNTALGTPQYQGFLNETRECVLQIDENKVVTGNMGIKTYVGKAVSVGEIAYQTEAGTTKYMDTFYAMDASPADIATEQAKLDRFRVELDQAKAARAAASPAASSR